MKIDIEKGSLPMYSTRCRIFDKEKSGIYHAYGVPFVANNDDEAVRIFRAQLGSLRVMSQRSKVAPFDRVIQLCRVGTFRIVVDDQSGEPLFVPQQPDLIDSDYSFEESGYWSPHQKVNGYVAASD